jgi:hypothetical protein
MASRHLNTRAYQAKEMTDRTNGTLCSKPALESVGGEVPQPSAEKKVVEEVEKPKVRSPRKKKSKE